MNEPVDIIKNEVNEVETTGPAFTNNINQLINELETSGLHLKVKVLTGQELKGAMAAFAAPQENLKDATIFISAEWLSLGVNSNNIQKILLEEGCLTFPGFFVKVKRPSVIKVRYTEPNGNIVTKKFVGMTARIFQHEIEHLNGEMFFKDCTKSTLELAIKKSKKSGFNYTQSDFFKLAEVS